MSATATDQESTMTDRATTMRAIVHDKYGSPDVLELKEIDKPVLTEGGVLVRATQSRPNRPT